MPGSNQTDRTANAGMGETWSMPTVAWVDAPFYGTAKHVVFVGRHTYYGAAPDSPLFHVEDEPPMGLSSFPELADLVAADLYAGSALWRYPEFTTSVLRFVYTLGTTGHGTLATFRRGARVPTILGYDPLFHFMHEEDHVRALALALDKRPRGVFNVAGPQPVPLSVVIRETGRTNVPLPEIVFHAASRKSDNSQAVRSTRQVIPLVPCRE